MKIAINNKILELTKGDITTEKTDAIANAANTRLAGGGGVDGAIHRAGGPEIMAECRKIGSCPTGEAVITTAGALPCKYVIHTAGPIYRSGKSGEAEKLESSYRNCMKRAAEKNLKSIAFPSISTGVYRYPLNEAAEIALRAVISILQENNSVELVRFILFDDKTLDAYTDTLQKIESEI